MWATDQIPAKEKDRAVPDVELYSMLNTALDASDNVRVSAPQVTDTLIAISFALLTPPYVTGVKKIDPLLIKLEISTLRVVPDIVNGGELVEPEEQEALEHN